MKGERLQVIYNSNNQKRNRDYKELYSTYQKRIYHLYYGSTQPNKDFRIINYCLVSVAAVNMLPQAR